MRWIVILIIFLAGAPRAVANSNLCEDELQGTLTIEADLYSPEGLSRSYRSVTDAFLRLTKESRERPPVVDLLFAAHRKVAMLQQDVFNHPERIPRYLKAMREFSRDVSFYERSIHVAHYARFASAIQRYFATVLVGYFAAKSGVAPETQFTAVDLGAGVGDSAVAIKRAFANAHVIATDKSARFLEGLEFLYPELLPLRHDFTTALPFKGGSVNLVTSITAATLFLNRGQFAALAREVHRVLSPGGYFLFEFGPHTARVTGKNVRAFAKSLERFGFAAETVIGMRIHWNGEMIYPVLLRKR